MKFIQNLKDWCASHPKMIASLIAAIAAILTAVLTSSCGMVRASVVNRATGTTTEIRVSNTSPTTVSVTPDVDLNLGRSTN